MWPAVESSTLIRNMTVNVLSPSPISSSVWAGVAGCGSFGDMWGSCGEVGGRDQGRQKLEAVSRV